jgi:hypothetical protein
LQHQRAQRADDHERSQRNQRGDEWRETHR